MFLFSICFSIVTFDRRSGQQNIRSILCPANTLQYIIYTHVEKITTIKTKLSTSTVIACLSDNLTKLDLAVTKETSDIHREKTNLREKCRDNR